VLLIIDFLSLNFPNLRDLVAYDEIAFYVLVWYCNVCVVCIQFDQHAELRQQLLDTGNERIVFVCKNDFFLGSGCDAQTLSDARTYSGRNRLGKSLMTLRLKLQVSIC